MKIIPALVAFAMLTACGESYTVVGHDYYQGSSKKVNRNKCSGCLQDMNPDGKVGDLVSGGSVTLKPGESVPDTSGPGPAPITAPAPPPPAGPPPATGGNITGGGLPAPPQATS